MEGEETPCDGCPDKQPSLFASNILAWEAWSILNEFGRPFAVGMAIVPLHLPPDKMRHEVEARGGDEDDFDRIVFIERKMFQAIQELHKQDK